MEVITRWKPLTQEQKQEILRLYGLRIRNKSIAIIIGCTKAQVDRVIYKDNPDIRNRNRVWTMDDLKEIKRLYIEKRYSTNRIARIFGVPNGHVADFLRRNGVKAFELKRLRT